MVGSEVAADASATLLAHWKSNHAKSCDFRATRASIERDEIFAEICFLAHLAPSGQHMDSKLVNNIHKCMHVEYSLASAHNALRYCTHALWFVLVERSQGCVSIRVAL